MQASAKKKTWFDKFLDVLERSVNKLPAPAIMFIYLFLIIAVVSAVVAAFGGSVTNPATQEVVQAKNLFSAEGLEWFLSNMLKNFTGFAPLGLVITMTLAIGLCEESGMIATLLNDKLRNVPPKLLPLSSPLWACAATWRPIRPWSLFRPLPPSCTWRPANTLSSA